MAGLGRAGESSSPLNLTTATSAKQDACWDTGLKTRKQKGCFMYKAHPSPLHKGRQMPTKWMWKIEKGRGSLVEILINLLNSLSVSPSLRLPHGSAVKSLPANAGELVLIPGSRRCPLGENGNLLQCSCLENPHGQRCLAGYIPWGGRVGHDLATDFRHY